MSPAKDGGGQLLSLRIYQMQLGRGHVPHPSCRSGMRGVQIQEELAKPTSRTTGLFDTEAVTGMPLHDEVASWERYLIEQALKASHGNKSDAARRLGIHQRLVYEKLTQFGML
jgi:DNA-binding NtrC family response regulator